MSFYEEESTGTRVYDRRIAGRLLRYLHPYRLRLAWSLLMMLAVASLELVPVLIVRTAIDGHIATGNTAGLGPLALVLGATLAVTFVLRYAQLYLMTWVGQRAMVDLRMELFTHVQRLSVAFFDRNPVGRVVIRLTGDVQQIEMVISQGVVQILTNLLIVAAVVVAMVALDWRLTLVLMTLVVPLIVLVQRFADAQRQAYRDQRIWMARINAYLNELITGVTIIQLFNRQRRNLELFQERNAGALDANMRVLFWYAAFEPTVVLFNALTAGVIIWFGGRGVIGDAVTVGTLVAFLSFMQRFFWPVRELTERYTMLQGAMASAERIFRVLDEPEEVRDADDAGTIEQVRGEITFDRVWFAYHEPNWVLRDVSFTVQPGEQVAVVGATGAGKSTLMALLSRFYDVQRGAIRVDGIPLGALQQRWLRRHVGTMLQEPWVFTDTIEENIRLRDRSISMAQVRAAADAVGATDFIERLPEGFATVLAERGANLSTGQKQLIALARVAAFNPSIVLVMDEATASLDPETEATIQRGLRTVMAGRTAIIIAHRLNTIRAVDRIIVLHQGEVAETGTHTELLVRGGIYARLYELQYHIPSGG